MEELTECTCISEDFTFDFSSQTENEDLEEIDVDELIEDKSTPHNIIWQEICNEFIDKRRQIEEYKASKVNECEKLLNPAVQYLENEIFPHLINILEETVNKAKELECLSHQKVAFNAIDFIAEMLWNLNPLYPQRKDNWTYIFDMDWVIKRLRNHPRPYYPLSWIWSREYGATKIQAVIRGHWARCRDNVQEMRQFWKVLKKEKEEAPLEIVEQPKQSKVKIPD